MNIKQAKQEIHRTIQAYLATDELGEYLIPRVRQRPILLMGAPGIGKTAIMEQIAAENQIALVSYSITHHTRQSAIGLPFISHKKYGNKEYAVTEYTMSEIIASVYDKMEETGIKNGILFIDEINCASETLAPAMLQFLQAKTFGAHKIPDGWIIVSAGNPPEYNKSVREFDVVTLDRVKKMDVTADFIVWKEYAYRQGIHGAILTYLEIKKDDFYAMETTVDGKRFVTARGWEDLSTIIQVYEKNGESVDETLIYQYLQHRKIAKDFANYYDLYQKYQTDYRITDILKGIISPQSLARLEGAAFDERLSIMGLLISALTISFRQAYESDLFVTALHDVLSEWKNQLSQSAAPWTDTLSLNMAQAEVLFTSKKSAGLLDKSQQKCHSQVLSWLERQKNQLLTEQLRENDIAFSQIKSNFVQEVAMRQNHIDTASAQLEHTFSFLEKAFGTGQEMVIFITELSTNFYSITFISENGSEKYYRYNKDLLFDERQKDLLSEIRKAKNENIL